MVLEPSRPTDAMQLIQEDEMVNCSVGWLVGWFLWFVVWLVIVDFVTMNVCVFKSRCKCCIILGL